MFELFLYDLSWPIFWYSGEMNHYIKVPDFPEQTKKRGSNWIFWISFQCCLGFFDISINDWKNQNSSQITILRLNISVSQVGSWKNGNNVTVHIWNWSSSGWNNLNKCYGPKAGNLNKCPRNLSPFQSSCVYPIFL